MSISGWLVARMHGGMAAATILRPQLRPVHPADPSAPSSTFSSATSFAAPSAARGDAQQRHMHEHPSGQHVHMCSAGGLTMRNCAWHSWHSQGILLTSKPLKEDLRT